jgi:hypothetical protein
MRCKNCNRLYYDGYEDGEYLCRIFGYGDDLDENGKRYIFVNSKDEEGCKYTEKQLQKIEKQIREAELEFNRKQDEIFYKKNREKLDKIEDLEDELGCPLEVVFEAIKEGIYCVDYDNQKIRKFIAPLCFNSTSKQFYWYGNNIGYPDLKDYKKTWWLPSDKEWKDE